MALSYGFANIWATYVQLIPSPLEIFSLFWSLQYKCSQDAQIFKHDCRCGKCGGRERWRHAEHGSQACPGHSYHTAFDATELKSILRFS